MLNEEFSTVCAHLASYYLNVKHCSIVHWPLYLTSITKILAGHAVIQQMTG